MSEPINISDLTLDPKNPRRRGPRAEGMLVASLQEVGAARSIVVDEDGRVLAGNGTVQAAAEAGIERVQVVDADGETLVAVRRRGLTEAQKRRLSVLDNRTGELAEWDAGVLAELAEDGLKLDDLWSDEELTALLDGAGEPHGLLTDPDAIPAEGDVETRCKPGDLWRMGDHRLLCGDSTKREDVERLMGGEKAATLVTSPPYWTGQAYDDAPGRASVMLFMDKVAATWRDRVDRRIQIQTGHANTTTIGERANRMSKVLLDAMWANAWERAGWLLRHRRAWVKGGAGLHLSPSADLIDESWEVLLTFYRAEAYHGGTERVGTWAIAGYWDDIPGTSIEGHPCPFPVEIASRMTQLYSQRGDMVTDPFLGSGTTLIAAEQLGRRCYGMEIEPRYCDVVLTRWEQATGRTAERIEHGTTIQVDAG